MNRNNNENKHQDRTTHATHFSNVHPPGGLVAWPDGSTSKIGGCRDDQPMNGNGFTARRGFVAWPSDNHEAMRA